MWPLKKVCLCEWDKLKFLASLKLIGTPSTWYEFTKSKSIFYLTLFGTFILDIRCYGRAIACMSERGKNITTSNELRKNSRIATCLNFPYSIENMKNIDGTFWCNKSDVRNLHLNFLIYILKINTKI